MNTTKGHYFYTTKQSHRWDRWYQSWGWGYALRQAEKPHSTMWIGKRLRRHSKILYAKSSSDKYQFEWAHAFKDKRWWGGKRWWED